MEPSLRTRTRRKSSARARLYRGKKQPGNCAGLPAMEPDLHSLLSQVKARGRLWSGHTFAGTKGRTRNDTLRAMCRLPTPEHF